MKVYKVGGAVRDKYMGITPKDTDWVVVGSSPEEMIRKGFKKVGFSEKEIDGILGNNWYNFYKTI